MGRTACTEPQCLYKRALYLFILNVYIILCFAIILEFVCVSRHILCSELVRFCEDLQYQRSMSSVQHSFTQTLRHW